MKKENVRLKGGRELVYGGKYELDKKDILIIKALYKDSRMSFSDIAKQAGLSRDAVRYRMEKLIENDVIQGFFPLLNPPKLGFPLLTLVHISLQKFDAESEKKLVMHLKENDFVSNLASLTGRWDYFFVVSSRDLGHFNTIMKDIRNKFPVIIRDYETENVVQTFKVSMYNNLLDKA